MIPTPSPRRTVWVVNRSSHDFSSAEKFGCLRFLSEGLLRKRNVTQMMRVFEAALSDSSPSDFILPTSLTVMSIVAALAFAQKHGKVNLLLYEDGRYKNRTICLKEFQDAH